MLLDKNNNICECAFVNEGDGIIAVTFNDPWIASTKIKKYITDAMHVHGLVAGYDYTMNSTVSSRMCHHAVKIVFVHEQDFTIMKLKYG
jgi:hypothetical protein